MGFDDVDPTTNSAPLGPTKAVLKVSGVTRIPGQVGGLSIVLFYVYVNGEDHGTTGDYGSPLIHLDNLTPGSTYSVTVRAYEAGYWSEYSAPFVFTTPLG